MRAALSACLALGVLTATLLAREMKRPAADCRDVLCGLSGWQGTGFSRSGFDRQALTGIFGNGIDGPAGGDPAALGSMGLRKAAGPAGRTVFLRAEADDNNKAEVDNRAEAEGAAFSTAGCRIYSPDRKDYSFAEPAALPIQTGLPDPLVMRDGRVVTSAGMWWQERRPELISLFQHYMTGQLPPKPDHMAAEVIHEDRQAFEGKAVLREVRLTFSGPQVPPIHLLLIVPNHRTRPSPVVLGINYYGNHTLVQDPKVRLHDLWVPAYGKGVVNNRVTEEMRGSWAEVWRIADVIARGYAVASFYNGDVDPDRPDERGLRRYFTPEDPADASGTIGAWAWGLMRAADYLVTAPEIDGKRIIVTGHSRMGKAALFAAAFDERMALVIPHQAGTGGSAPSRTLIKPEEPLNTVIPKWGLKPCETIASLNEKLPYWFNARFKEFSSQPERLPFDQHCLVALCAPRPVLFTNGRADTWINPAGQFSVLEAAAPVYRLLGAGDFTIKPFPSDGELAVSGKLGFFLRAGYHSLESEDWKAFLDFADQQLGRP